MADKLVPRPAVLAFRKEDAGLLEAFADRRHPEGEAARVHAEARARLGVGEPGDAAQHARVAVGPVERAARKDVRAAEKRRIVRTLQQQRLRAEAAVAQQKQRRGRPGDERLRHFRRPGRRGPCRSAP